jgi:hypothetical protein
MPPAIAERTTDRNAASVSARQAVRPLRCGDHRIGAMALQRIGCSS